MQFIYNQNELSTKIFDFIYRCSMHDAILQRAFLGKKDWVGKVEQAKPPLRKYIDNILNNEFSSQEKHDLKFIETANEICKAINANQPPFAKDVFSFGNAQKLINIMVKHTYSVCYHNPDLRKNFCYCHSPLDSIMLQEVWTLYKKKFGETKRKETLIDYKYFCQPWGNEGQQDDIQPEISEFPERYIKFQVAIRDIIGDEDFFPIEFDYWIWK